VIVATNLDHPSEGICNRWHEEGCKHVTGRQPMLVQMHYKGMRSVDFFHKEVSIEPGFIL